MTAGIVFVKDLFKYVMYLWYIIIHREKQNNWYFISIVSKSTDRMVASLENHEAKKANNREVTECGICL